MRHLAIVSPKVPKQLRPELWGPVCPGVIVIDSRVQEKYDNRSVEGSEKRFRDKIRMNLEVWGSVTVENPNSHFIRGQDERILVRGIEPRIFRKVAHRKMPNVEGNRRAALTLANEKA